MKLVRFCTQLRFDEEVGTAFVEGKNYSLKQVHWHTPTEHTLDGKRYIYMFSSLVDKLSPLLMKIYRWDSQICSGDAYSAQYKRWEDCCRSDLLRVGPCR